MSKFSLFDDALSGVGRYAHSMSPYMAFAKGAVDGIRQGQRFYMPYGGGAIADRKFSDFFGVMELPYPITVVATEAPDDEGYSSQWVIVCHQIPGEVGFEFYACLNSTDNPAGWVPIPKGKVGIGAKGGLEIGLYDNVLTRLIVQETPSFRAGRAFAPIVSTVVALCVMLSLKNVKTEAVEPSAALNAKRKAKGKRPLYSYKILNVDGERWESNGSDNGDGQGYRSHLRRGHIRRLSDDRAVWVRATYVHGRVAGFVDKDYNVVEPA